MRILIFSVLVLSITLLGCKDFSFMGGDSKDPVVAKVGDRNLFKSQLTGLIHEGISKSDSAAIIDGFIQSWVRENLMIAEAEKNVAADINLDKLVDEYRSSLLVYNYENRLVDQKLDTMVSNSEKVQYYLANKSQYILSHPIFKCVVAKIPSKAQSGSTVKKALEKSDLTETMFLFKDMASFHFIDTAKWITIQDLNAMLPAGMLESNDIAKGKIFQKKEKDSEYYVKILKYVDEKEIPPFDYIADKINKAILSDRKIQLLQEIRQSLYNKGMSDKGFEIFK